jgi:hypothetical protein
LDFVIDPFAIAGRGQIYAEPQTIENRGDTDVLVSFSDISVVFANAAETEAMTAPFDEYADTGSARKAIYLLLDFGRADIPPLVLTDEAARVRGANVVLGAAGSEDAALTLGLAGIVNCDTNAGWRDGEVKISLYYHMEVLPAPEAEEPATETQEARTNQTADIAPASPPAQNASPEETPQETNASDPARTEDETSRAIPQDVPAADGAYEENKSENDETDEGGS